MSNRKVVSVSTVLESMVPFDSLISLLCCSRHSGEKNFSFRVCFNKKNLYTSLKLSEPVASLLSQQHGILGELQLTIDTQIDMDCVRYKIWGRVLFDEQVSALEVFSYFEALFDVDINVLERVFRFEFLFEHRLG